MAHPNPYNTAPGLNTTPQRALLEYNQTLSPEEQRRLLARALARRQAASNYSPIASPWQGAARLAEGLFGGLEQGALMRQMRDAQEAEKIDLDTMLNTPRLGGTSATPGLASSSGTSLNNIIGSIDQQESGGNPRIADSPSGAVGRGQIMPGTFAQYAHPGEDIRNTEDNLAVRRRIISDYHQQYGGDPARIAVAYFSGPGNVAPPGSTQPFLHDRADPTGKTVSSYVADVLGRLGNAPGAIAMAASSQNVQRAGNIPSPDTAAPAQSEISRAQAEVAARLLDSSSPGTRQFALDILKAYMVPRQPPQTAAPGEGIYDPATGTYPVRVPKEGASQPSEVLEYQFDQKDRKERGLPPISYSDFRMNKKLTITGGGGPLLDRAGQPIDPELTGPDIFKAIPPEVANRARAILDGREKFPTGYMLRNPVSLQAVMVVEAVEPGFDAAKAEARFATRKSYSPGGAYNSPGALIVTGDAALDHLLELKKASDKVANLGSILGTAAQGAASITGGRLFGDYSAAVSDLDAQSQIASTEAMKYLAGVGAGGEREREAFTQRTSSSTPPDSRRAAWEALAKDILQKKIEFHEGWRRVMGSNEPDFPVISPNAIKNVKALGLNVPPEINGGAPAAAMDVMGAAAVKIRGDADYDKLPSGAQYIGPDGQTRVKR